MKDCNVEGLFKFPGMIVFDGDVRMWAGTTYDGLDRYIERHLGIDPDLIDDEDVISFDDDDIYDEVI